MSRSAGKALAQRQAADWFALLSSGDASASDHRQWGVWRAAAPEHEAAWQQVEALLSRFQGLPPALAQSTLLTPALDRRAALKLLAALLAVGGAAAAGVRSDFYQQTFAEFSTGTGQRRQWTLADGTQLHLNARSAAEAAFDHGQRHLRLHGGDFLIDTAPWPAHPQRPLQVDTTQAQLRAEAARFVVSQHQAQVQISVLHGALQVKPTSAPWVRLLAGQALLLQPGRAAVPMALDAHVAAWQQGLVFADGLPLRQYLTQLAAYRAGVLSCDEAAGRLRISGVFALAHSDRLLAQLPDILPVRVRYFSRYWVRVEALA
ncbi:FecR domain-containing protein [Pseudomonas cremoricolorata]|uniref:FecR domain-containing protein n=1 Tax=Pseudomonas cremoricolorata TaxID=157783 RepID=UPI00041943FB|nr:FecR domain-containing protein [Pseudomonas cremoricolorata]